MELADVFGVNLKAIRRRHGVTLDEVAKASRQFGTKWTAQRVAGMESGKVSVTVATVCTAAWALSEVSPVLVHPGDLLRTEAPIEVHPGFAVSGDAVADTLEGEVGQLRIGDLADPRAAATEMAEGMSRILSEWGPGMTMGDARRLDSRIGLADRRAADRLGVSARRLSGAAFQRWGQLLSEAVDEQAGVEASPQRKGHVTRKLEAELREVLDRGDD
ncbi:helix-turn-helix domain-containing protein [Brevibacterium sp. R8603A2]|uniref:helix-turn-helix domain-containing protein n=1 Tax=Brevibacterium sp. R8603A2 TaxID=2929779 RepID=UPI001FF7ACEF|nr:helix-turn-helix transcriptional regulator [Brevibacterium sp. R8603A2]MCK1801781.1 helix-turn-helix domain-containing protein [Brevibacterium sp. R8603A2]